MPPVSKPQYCISLRIDKQILHNSIDDDDEAEFYLVTKLLDKCVGRLKVESEVNAPVAASEVASTTNTPVINNKDTKKISSSPAKQSPQKRNVGRPAKKTRSGSPRSRSRSITKADDTTSPNTSKPSTSGASKPNSQSPQQQSTRKPVPQKRANKNTSKHGTLKETLHVIEKRSRTRTRSRANAANLYADKTLRRIKRNKQATPSEISVANESKMVANEHECDHECVEVDKRFSVENEQDEEKKESKEPIDLQTWILVTGRPKRQSIVPKRFEHSPKKRKLWGSPNRDAAGRKETPASKKQKQEEKDNDANDKSESVVVSSVNNEEMKAKENSELDESVQEILDGVDQPVVAESELHPEQAAVRSFSSANNKQTNGKEGEEIGDEDCVVDDVEIEGDCVGEEIVKNLDVSIDNNSMDESIMEVPTPAEENGEEGNIFDALKKPPDQEEKQPPMRFKTRKKRATDSELKAKGGEMNKVSTSNSNGGRNNNNVITQQRGRGRKVNLASNLSGRQKSSMGRTKVENVDNERSAELAEKRRDVEEESEGSVQNHRNGTSTPQEMKATVVPDGRSSVTSFECDVTQPLTAAAPVSSCAVSAAAEQFSSSLTSPHSPANLLVPDFNSTSPSSAVAPPTPVTSVTVSASSSTTPPLCANGKTTITGSSGRRCFLCFDSGNNLIMCAKCPRVFHGHCLIPPLKQMPVGDWFCRICCKGTRLSQS